MKLSFYGSSDDNFCYDINDKPTDEKGCYNTHEFFKVSSGEESVIVMGHYSPDRISTGCWMVGLMKEDEDNPLPSWNYRFRHDGYTVILDMDVPDDAVVS